MQQNPLTYTLRTHKASRTLRGFHNMVLLAAEAAVRMGDATPTAVLAELRGVLELLAERWRGRTRAEVLQMPPTRVEP